MLRMSAVSLWLATVSLIAGVQGVPNYQLSTSGIAIPQGSEALDNGEIVVRVQRIDDIFSGDIEHQAASKLLLEKKTHIVLRVSLDQAQQTVNVNDQPVYRHFETLGDLDNAAPVSVVKAESYTIPDSNGESPLSAQEAHALLSQLSPGIVGVEVKAELKPLTTDVPVNPTMLQADDSLTVSLRQLGLSIRVIEIEGQEVPPHISTAFVPILQMVLHSDSDKIVEVETLHIGDAVTSTIEAPQQSKINEAIAQIAPLGPVIVNAETFPELEPMIDPAVMDRVRKVPCKYRKGPHDRLFEEHSTTKAIFDWLHSLFFGERAHFRGQWHRHHRGREGHAMMAENPFTGLMEKVGGNDKAAPIGLVEEFPQLKQGLSRPHRHPQEGDGEHERHPHFHHHGQGMHPHGPHRWHGHGRSFHRFFHRVAIGFVYGLAVIITTLMHPAFIYGACVPALCGMVFFVAFFVARRMSMPSEGGEIRLVDDDDSISIDSKDTIIIDIDADMREEKLPAYGDDEKQ